MPVGSSLVVKVYMSIMTFPGFSSVVESVWSESLTMIVALSVTVFTLLH